MISEELKQIVEGFEEQERMSFVEPASEEQIAQFTRRTIFSCCQNIKSGYGSVTAGILKIYNGGGLV
jgi:hypothetical protein